MSDCECLEKCPFFNDKMENMPATTEMYKKRCCKENFEKYARYMIFKKLGREKVPADLFPNHTERAEQILTEN